MKKLSGIILFSILILSSCYYDNKEDLYVFYQNQCDTTAISYSLDIEPIIDVQCKICHQQPTPDAGLSLENYDEVKAIAVNGSLVHSINATGGYSIMPVSGKMIQCNIDKIDAWIQAGTPNN